MAKFSAFSLSPTMIEACAKEGYQNPSEIQKIVIPKILREESLVVTSETGSGKTHAFLIPILDKIDISKNEVQAIIVSPTTQLARQTYEFARALAAYFPTMRILFLSNQMDSDRAIGKLKQTPHVIIATPGKIYDLGVEEKICNLVTAKFLVLDEADMLLDMGFSSQITDILDFLPNTTKLVFSATIKENLMHMIEKYVHADGIISTKTSTNHSVKQFAIYTKNQDRKEQLLDFLGKIHPYFMLVFASKKEVVSDLYDFLRAKNFTVGLLHGDLSPRERKNMMKRIKNNEFPIVVASDMAARGMDIEGVSDVLNFDLPKKDLSFFFHRAGRTGRFDKDGNCYTFYDDDDVEILQKLKQQGAEFTYWVPTKDGYKEGKPTRQKKVFVSHESTELTREIKRAVAETKTKKVKPGYKRKVKTAIEKVKRKHRRRNIEKDIRRQRVERYKREAKKRGE